MAKKYKMGGFVQTWRQIYDSEVMRKPPHFREIWRYLFENAAYKDCTRKGKGLKRGQILTSYKEISDALSWFVGKRIERYKKHHIDMAFRFFQRTTMATTAKTTAGMIVTILKYNEYQTPKGHETDRETDRETDTLDFTPYIVIIKKEIYVGVIKNKLTNPKRVKMKDSLLNNIEKLNELMAEFFMVRKQRKDVDKNWSEKDFKSQFGQLLKLYNDLSPEELIKARCKKNIKDFIQEAIDYGWKGFSSTISGVHARHQENLDRAERYKDVKKAEIDNRPEIPEFDQLDQFKGKS